MYWWPLLLRQLEVALFEMLPEVHHLHLHLHLQLHLHLHLRLHLHEKITNLEHHCCCFEVEVIEYFLF